MKKHILAAIGIVLISVPCFAQGIKADSLSAGSVASSGSIDGSGNIVLSNSFTGAHSLIGTNAHLMFVDQYGTEFYFWTNGFGFWKTNGDYAYATNGGDFHISGTFYGGGLGGSGPTNWPWSSITNQPTIPSTANLLATNGNASALTGLTSAQIAAAGGVTNVPSGLVTNSGPAPIVVTASGVSSTMNSNSINVLRLVGNTASVPTIKANTNAIGAGGTAALMPGSSDLAGTILLVPTVGTGSSLLLLTNIFGTPFQSIPVVLVAMDGSGWISSSGSRCLDVAGKSTTQFTVSMTGSGALTANVTNGVSYIVIGQ